jgi:hypothetical protein
MKRIGLSGAIVLLSCSLSGCLHSHRTYLSDGKSGYSISCGGMFTSWTRCLVKAGRLCGKGGYSIPYSDEVNRELLVECRSAPDPFLSAQPGPSAH